jgi:hypothetical protein
MGVDSLSLALAIAGALFLFYVLLKLRYSLLPASAEVRDVKRRIQQAQVRAHDRNASAELRARAFCEAAQVALEELGRPNLAASYARRAQRVDPSLAEAVRLLSVSLQRGGRLRALERLLWRRLAREDAASPGYQRAYDELVKLYSGPMKKPDRAAVLKRMRTASIPPSDYRTRSE